MTAFILLAWSKVKLVFKKYWVIIVGGLLGFLSLLSWFLFENKKEKPRVVVVKDKKEETQRRLAEVEAKAAVEIGRAQGQEESVKQEVEEIQREPDSRKRRERLAALLAR